MPNRRAAFAAAARAAALLAAPLGRLVLSLATSAPRGIGDASGAGGVATLLKAVSALWADVGSQLWRSMRPIIAFTTHVALRLNAHRVSILREAEARAGALRARLLGTPQKEEAQAATGEEAAVDGDGDDGEFVLSRVPLSPVEEDAERRGRSKLD